MKVRDIMQRDAKVCSPGNSLATAGVIMKEVSCGVLPVVGDEDKVVGMITDRDIAMALAERDRRPSEVQVRQVMTGEVYACRADDDVREALKVMREHRVRRLPVVDRNHCLQGILCLDDVVMEAQAIETETFSGPFYADITWTLKAINKRPPAAA